MKKLFILAIACLFLSSCAFVRSPVSGVIYGDVTSPVAATSNSNSSKVGTAEATSILGIIATGDASIQAAAKSAGITKIHHVDEQAINYFIFYAKYKVYVYGE
ncbi:MAG: TRL-like family protein [Bacteroidota bacterium]|nr:TRL-like family protein [Bacteroidota bacterium]